MRLEWEAARDAEVYDAWATITVIVVALVLSVQSFQGADFALLIPHHSAMPREFWRHLTAGFLHGGWLHLVMNVLWMLQLGALAEALLGLTAYSVLVVALAMLSSMAQWVLSGPGIGLSGVVYGLFGLLWALDRWHPACRGVMNKRTADFFGAWFLFCVLASWQGWMRIGNAAHGAGFLFGALTGWALAAGGGRRWWRFGAAGAGALLLAVLQVPAARHVVNRSGAYDRELFGRGVERIEAGDLAGAIELYEELTRRAPRMGRAWHNLAYAYQEAGRFEEARAAAGRALELEEVPSE